MNEQPKEPDSAPKELPSALADALRRLNDARNARKRKRILYKADRQARKAEEAYGPDGAPWLKKD